MQYCDRIKDWTKETIRLIQKEIGESLNLFSAFIELKIWEFTFSQISIINIFQLILLPRLFEIIFLSISKHLDLIKSWSCKSRTTFTFIPKKTWENFFYPEGSKGYLLTNITVKGLVSREWLFRSNRQSQRSLITVLWLQKSPSSGYRISEINFN